MGTRTYSSTYKILPCLSWYNKESFKGKRTKNQDFFLQENKRHRKQWLSNVCAIYSCRLQLQFWLSSSRHKKWYQNPTWIKQIEMKLSSDKIICFPQDFLNLMLWINVLCVSGDSTLCIGSLATRSLYGSLPSCSIMYPPSIHPVF